MAEKKTNQNKKTEDVWVRIENCSINKQGSLWGYVILLCCQRVHRNLPMPGCSDLRDCGLMLMILPSQRIMVPYFYSINI